MLQSIALSCREQLRAGFRETREPTATELEGLAAAYGEGRQRWPDIDVTPGTFARAVALRTAPDDVLGRLHLLDLYLVCGCIAASDRALDAFDAEFLRPTIASLSIPDDDRDEVAQRMRTSLLLDRDGSGPRLGNYRARGPLRRWLRVAALRGALAVRPRPSDAEALDSLVDPSGDPELVYLRELYSDEVRTVLGEAFSALDRRSKGLLRHSLVDRLTVDQIARIYHLPRATAGRHLLRARQQLVQSTHDRLKARFDWSSEQLGSMLRLLQSKLDLGGSVPERVFSRSKR